MEKKLVMPGDFIGTEEEYIAGAGTYSDNERIYASIAGELREEARKLSVVQGQPLSILGPGAVIIGKVENIVEPIALVSVQMGDTEAHRFGENGDYAVLHASMIKRGYVKNVRDEYKVGDLIRAKIADIRNGEIRLATDADELGAIKAYCGKCRHPMKVESGVLKCESCEWKDNRKLAKDYRKGTFA
ncbi:Exosome complex component Csl4 [uncultured archaeon]|nr:Exosome complex component Csl4 [uncultured archaeon]